MTRSVLSLAILYAALAGSMLLTSAVRSETGDDSQATKPLDSGCCPAACLPLYEEEYGYHYEGYGCDIPQDAPKCNETEESIASDQTEDEAESASEVATEEYTYEDVDYWYDCETGEYHDYSFADDVATEEMTVEETVEAVAEEASPFEEPADVEATILVEDASIATTEEKQAYDDTEYEHAYDEMYDYEAEYAYDYSEYVEPMLEEEVEATTETPTESVASEESEDAYDDYWDDCHWDEEEESHFEEESVELAEETPAPSTDESVDSFDYGYEYSDEYEAEYAEGMEPIAEDSEQVVEETAEAVTENSDEYDYSYEYWDEYDYYHEEAEEAELVESSEESEDGELGADAELEYWTEVALEDMIVASQQREQSDNDREAILSLARTLDRVGTALQGLSRHLAEMADAEVAEMRASDDSIQR